MEKRLSIVIPVHNGEKYIKKTVRSILNQTYSNIEVILVENFSKDHSYQVCSLLANKDPRVKVLKCNEKGTSMARKMGVEKSTGDYIAFCDQDDHYIDVRALEDMIKSIIKDETDICQFSYYKEYLPFVRRKIEFTNQSKVLTADEVSQNYIKGVLGAKGSYFDTTVWSKIYKADLLKEAVSHINAELYFAEDEYLNIWAYSSKYLRTVSVRNEAYYCWKTKTGFSSSNNSGEALLKDYEIVKPLAVETASKCIDKSILWYVHGEGIYCFRAVIIQMIKNNISKDVVLSKIKEIDSAGYIVNAKHYFREKVNPKRVWDDLRFVSSDYSAEEYYEYCLKQISKEKQMRNNTFKRIKKKLKTLKLFNKR